MKSLKQYSGSSVLIIDDSDTFVKVAVKHMKECGLKKVYFALNGIEGIKLAKKYKPDVVLLDIELGPSISGFNVLEEFHKSSLNLKVMLITSYDTGLSGMRGARLGITDFVPKVEFFESIDIKIMEAIDFGHTIFEKQHSPFKIIQTNFDILEKIFLTFDLEQQNKLLERLNHIRGELKSHPPDINKINKTMEFIKNNVVGNLAVSGIIEIVKGLLLLI